MKNPTFTLMEQPDNIVQQHKKSCSTPSTWLMKHPHNTKKHKHNVVKHPYNTNEYLPMEPFFIHETPIYQKYTQFTNM